MSSRGCPGTQPCQGEGVRLLVSLREREWKLALVGAPSWPPLSLRLRCSPLDANRRHLVPVRSCSARWNRSWHHPQPMQESLVASRCQAPPPWLLSRLPRPHPRPRQRPQLCLPHHRPLQQPRWRLQHPLLFLNPRPRRRNHRLHPSLRERPSKPEANGCWHRSASRPAELVTPSASTPHAPAFED